MAFTFFPGHVVGGGVNVVLFRVERLLGDAALLVVVDNIIDDVAGLAGDHGFGQVALDALEEGLGDLLADFAVLGLVPLVLQIGAHPFAQGLHILGSPRFGKLLVHFRQDLLLDLKQFDLINALFASQPREHEIAREINGDGAFLACLGPQQLGAESGQERILLRLDPETLVLRQALGGGGDVGDRFAVAGSGVMDHRDIAFPDGAIHGEKGLLTLAKQVQRAINVRGGGAADFALGAQALVFRQVKFRGGFHRGDKMEGLAARELNLLNIGRDHRGDFLVGHRLAIGIGDQLAF